MIIIRKFLDCIFSQRELKILDDVMPDTIKRSRADEEDTENSSSAASEANVLSAFLLRSISMILASLCDICDKFKFFFFFFIRSVACDERVFDLIVVLSVKRFAKKNNRYPVVDIYYGYDCDDISLCVFF